MKSAYEDDVYAKPNFHVSKASSDNRLLSQRTRGCLPNGAGVREDVFLVWSELEESRNILADVQNLLIDFNKVSEFQGECFVNRSHLVKDTKVFSSKRSLLSKSQL